MMRLPRFRYLAPKSVLDAVKMLSDGGPTAMPVAGGTDLYPNMKRRHQVPKTLVGLRGVGELTGIQGTPERGIRIGPNITLTQLERHPQIRAAHPWLAACIRSISTPILRNMGTIGGNLCLDTRCTYYNQNEGWRHSIDYCMKREGKICWVAPSSPRCWAVSSADTPSLLAAIGAQVRLLSSQGERTIPVADLYNDDGICYLKKRPDELLSDVYLPPANGWKAVYLKLRRRGAFDFPVLGVGACLSWEGDRIKTARIFLGAVHSYPIEAREAEHVLLGQRLTEDVIQKAAAQAFIPAKPLDNTDFHMTWRKEMVRVYVARALRMLASP